VPQRATARLPRERRIGARHETTGLVVKRQRVLVGVNVSAQGDEAIRQADEWARVHGWELVACHVAPSSRGVHPLFPQLVEPEALAASEIERRLGIALRKHVAALTGRSLDEIQAIVDTGAPDARLVREAEEQGAQLITIGSHSQSDLRQIFLGDVAESVVRHARSSVLVARPVPSVTKGQRGPVLVATDLSRDGTAVIAFAADHAVRIGAPLIVATSIERRMEVVRDLANFGTAYGFVENEYDETCRNAKEQLAAQMTAVGARGEPKILDGKPAPSIIQAAATTGAALIVLSAAAMSSWMPHLHKNVVLRVARAAPSSVLVARLS
jgi:nucleotide-binding universal stress UspA family protein